MIGFALHNATEGFGIAAPLTAGELPTWGFLAILGIIGGGPTFVGGVVGYSFTSDLLSIVFLGLAAGALIYVFNEMMAVSPEVLRADGGERRPAGRAVRGLRDGLRAGGRRRLSEHRRRPAGVVRRPTRGRRRRRAIDPATLRPSLMAGPVRLAYRSREAGEGGSMIVSAPAHRARRAGGVLHVRGR